MIRARRRQDSGEIPARGRGVGETLTLLEREIDREDAPFTRPVSYGQLAVVRLDPPPGNREAKPEAAAIATSLRERTEELVRIS
jgi:hypothetical protein